MSITVHRGAICQHATFQKGDGGYIILLDNAPVGRVFRNVVSGNWIARPPGDAMVSDLAIAGTREEATRKFLEARYK